MRKLALTWLLLSALARAQDSPDVTDDGLVRVPSNSRAGVYRQPVATFDQYRRVLFGPITVTFKKGYERNHREVTKKELSALRADLAWAYRKELFKELVYRGGYALTEQPSTDALRVVASIVDADVTAPKASAGLSERTYVRSAGSMKLVVELQDSVSGMAVARITNYEEAPDRGGPTIQQQLERGQLPPPTTQVSNLADFRIGFENSARYTHEAISVAKAGKREDQSQIKSEN